MDINFSKAEMRNFFRVRNENLRYENRDVNIQFKINFLLKALTH
jgi:hypothetical protein